MRRVLKYYIDVLVKNIRCDRPKNNIGWWRESIILYNMTNGIERIIREPMIK